MELRLPYTILIMPINSQPSDPCDSTFNAIKQVHSLKGKSDVISVSGIGAAKCARHGLLLPCSAVNLKLGERCVAVNYSQIAHKIILVMPQWTMHFGQHYC
jgi:hypothetical protein